MADPPDTGAPSSSAWSWDTVIKFVEVLAALAALTGWLVLIGAARVYERLSAAGIPAPTRTVTLLPRDLLLSEGVRQMAVSVITALIVAVAVVLIGAVFSRGDAVNEPAREVPVEFRSVLLGVLVAGADHRLAQPPHRLLAGTLRLHVGFRRTRCARLP